MAETTSSAQKPATIVFARPLPPPCVSGAGLPPHLFLDIRRVAVALMPIRLLLVLPYLASPVRAAVRDDGIVELPGLVSMASDAEPTVYSTVESFSKAKFLRRHRRDVIAGPTYAWASNEIPFQIYGGDCER